MGSEIIWSKFKEVNKSSSNWPSAFVLALEYHDCECTLKSPVKNIAYGLACLNSVASKEKFCIKFINSALAALFFGFL